LVGDFNGDNAVTGQDLSLWSTAYGSSAVADADGDGDSDGRDLLIWQRNHATQTGGGQPWLTFLTSDTHLIEATLGAAAFSADTSLGLAYDTMQDSRDLFFRYTTAAGEQVTGNVIYVGVNTVYAVPEPSAWQVLLTAALLDCAMGPICARGCRKLEHHASFIRNTQ
jgi:hypothetical protein